MRTPAQQRADQERSRKGGLARAAQRRAAEDRKVKDAEERLAACDHHFTGRPSRCTKCGEYELDTHVLATARGWDLDDLVKQWGLKRRWGETDASLRQRAICLMFPVP